MPSKYPSINDKEYDLVKKIVENTALIADVDTGTVVDVTGKTASYILTTSDYVVVFSGSTGAQTLTLPAVAGTTGRTFIIKNRASVSVSVAAAAAANEIFTTSAVSSVSLATGDSVTLISDGSYWCIV